MADGSRHLPAPARPVSSGVAGLSRRPRSRTGLARRIREYLAEHPASDVHTIALALGESDTKPVSHRCSQLAKWGVLRADRKPDRGPRGAMFLYTLVGEVRHALDLSHMTPEQKRAHRLEQQRRSWAARYAAKQAAKPPKPSPLATLAARVEAQPVSAERATVEPETYEQFLARGGKPQVIPVAWAAPSLRRAGRVNHRASGAL